MIALILFGVAGTAQTAWAVAGALLVFKQWLPTTKLVHTIWAELRPFYLPAVVVGMAIDFAHGRIWGWDMVFHVCFVLNWFLLKDIDDDDRWKRRGRKALEKITATDRGLVVVPAEASR